MHAKHLYIPHLARPLSAKAYGVSQCLVFAREDCSDGLLRRIAQKDCLVGLSGCSSWVLKLVSQVGVSYAAYAGLRLGTGPWVLEEHIDMAWVT